MAMQSKTASASSSDVGFRPSAMTDKVFTQISQYIHDRVGIKLPPTKRTMLEARLQKRLRDLNMSSYEQYTDFVFSEKGMEQELRNLIDVVTTNTTEFFREPKHFDFLAGHVLPEFVNSRKGSRPLRLWSAGCSIGMEPYTLGMVMADFAEQVQGFQFRILATDISSRALQTAVKAVYDEERVISVPDRLKKKYLLRSKDRSKRLVRIGPEVRSLVEFRRLNFMERFSFRNPMDVIFCRNVIIYFDKPTQERLFRQFCACMQPGGYLFIGHSESLTGLNLPLEQAAPTVYRRV